MRCMACGGEMILMKAIEDLSMAVPGFERRSYMCSVCLDTEQRLVFNKQAKEREIDPVPVLMAPPTAPASTSDTLSGRLSFLRHALAKLRSH